jgi:hypothetical protein
MGCAWPSGLPQNRLSGRPVGSRGSAHSSRHSKQHSAMLGHHASHGSTESHGSTKEGMCHNPRVQAQPHRQAADPQTHMHCLHTCSLTGAGSLDQKRQNGPALNPVTIKGMLQPQTLGLLGSLSSSLPTPPPFPQATVPPPHHSHSCAKGCHQQAAGCIAEAVELQPQGEEHHGLPGEAPNYALEDNRLQASTRRASSQHSGQQYWADRQLLGISLIQLTS